MYVCSNDHNRTPHDTNTTTTTIIIIINNNNNNSRNNNTNGARTRTHARTL